MTHYTLIGTITDRAEESWGGDYITEWDGWIKHWFTVAEAFLKEVEDLPETAAAVRDIITTQREFNEVHRTSEVSERLRDRAFNIYPGSVVPNVMKDAWSYTVIVDGKVWDYEHNTGKSYGSAALAKEEMRAQMKGLREARENELKREQASSVVNPASVTPLRAYQQNFIDQVLGGPCPLCESTFGHLLSCPTLGIAQNTIDGVARAVGVKPGEMVIFRAGNGTGKSVVGVDGKGRSALPLTGVDGEGK